jgi:serine acetyltransferase
MTVPSTGMTSSRSRLAASRRTPQEISNPTPPGDTTPPAAGSVAATPPIGNPYPRCRSGIAYDAVTMPGRAATWATCSRQRSAARSGISAPEAYTIPGTRICPRCGIRNRYGPTLMRFGTLRPQYCSIYDPYFWWHERYWKLMAPLIGMLNGTPFKSPVWRLAGVRIGRRVFDDGCSIAERTLVTIGDECTLNAGSVIQCHSMEDGIFKADFTVLEDGCTLGTGALVHYDVTMGQGAQLQPDSFLMKGEKVPPRARWGGNPARAM